MKLRRTLLALVVPALALGLLPMQPAEANTGVTIDAYPEGRHDGFFRMCATITSASGSFTGVAVLDVEGVGTNGTDVRPYLHPEAVALPGSPTKVCSAQFEGAGMPYASVRMGVTVYASSLTGHAVGHCTAALTWATPYVSPYFVDC